MELRRAADALVRSQSSPLATLLKPASTVRWTTNSQLGSKSSISCQSARSLSTTSKRTAIKPLPTTSSTRPPPAAGPSSPDSAPFNPVPVESSQTPSEKPKDDLASLTSSLGWADPNKLTPPRRAAFQPPAWSSSSLNSPREQRFNGGSSASDILDALNKTRNDKRAARDGGSSYSSFWGAPSGSAGSGSVLDASRMMSPLSSSDLMMSRDVERDTRILKPIRVPLKLGPSTGRSVHVGAGIDVGRGFRLLEQSCARNGVRRDANAQRFHERGGLKRKRLRRERWRRKFLEGFKATVGRVKQLKNQGW